MTSYPNEQDLLAALDRNDELVRLCAAGHLSFDDFCTQYDNFYWSYALDGHESDVAGRQTLAKHAERIRPHQFVAEAILGKVCSAADAAKESYRSAGRFGPSEAVVKLKGVAIGLPNAKA